MCVCLCVCVCVCVCVSVKVSSTIERNNGCKGSEYFSTQGQYSANTHHNFPVTWTVNTSFVECAVFILPYRIVCIERKTV